MYFIGKVTKTHGVKGEVKVKSETDFDRFQEGKTIYYIKKDGSKQFLEIESVRNQMEILLIKFKGLDNLDSVQVLKQKNLYADEDPELKENEFTVKELLGLKVYSHLDEYIGVVKDIMFLPKDDVLVVEKSDGKEALIPFIKQFILEVSDKIVVQVIEGLI